jgi:hypothetical protein
VHGHVGAGGHGDADVGRRQRRRVVDAVADHRHHAPPRSSAAARCAALSLRQHLGAHVVDAQRRATACALPRLSPDQHRAHAHACSARTRAGGAGLMRVAEGQQAQQRAGRR